jgi:hypothetical protein
MNALLRLNDSETSGRSRVDLSDTDTIVSAASNIQASGQPSQIRRSLRALVAFFSSPSGDQGGWEAGARGL